MVYLVFSDIFHNIPNIIVKTSGFIWGTNMKIVQRLIGKIW